ncbi:MAG: hypothetical protein ACFNOO_04525 [Segatella oulorum]|uniref:hypothetical protein n=1 Tax=Segatella oulorum TaxID=28136 RepID=UPI003613B0A9
MENTTMAVLGIHQSKRNHGFASVRLCQKAVYTTASGKRMSGIKKYIILTIMRVMCLKLF